MFIANLFAITKTLKQPSVSHSVMSNSFVTPQSIDHQTPLSMEFSRQEQWSGQPLPSPGDLSNPGIKSRPSTFQADFLSSELLGKPLTINQLQENKILPCIATWTLRALCDIKSDRKRQLLFDFICMRNLKEKELYKQIVVG